MALLLHFIQQVRTVFNTFILLNIQIKSFRTFILKASAGIQYVRLGLVAFLTSELILATFTPNNAFRTQKVFFVFIISSGTF